MRHKRSGRRNRAPRPYDRPDKPQVRLHLSGLGQGDTAPALARGLGQNTPDGNWRSSNRACRPAQAEEAKKHRRYELVGWEFKPAGYAKSERYFENDPAREVSKQGAAGRASKCIARRALSELNAILAPSWRRQERRLTRIELHVEGGEKCCRPEVIAHEGDEVDQSTAAELP